MKWFGWSLAIACVLLFRSASAQTSPPTIDLTGRWTGHYSGGTIIQPIRGIITMTLRQIGSDVTGTTVVTNTPTPAGLNGGLKGTVSGRTFTWVAPGGGGRATVRGKSMRGVTHRGTNVNLTRQ
jgi:hypothetical protein